MQRMTEKKKDMGLEEGAELIGYLIKKNNNYQIIADGRARNLSKEEYRALMQYPD
jgi:hypothetical protein